jgi:hypothetical protein
MNGEHGGRGDREGDRFEVLHGIIGNLVVQGGINDVVGTIDENGVPVGYRLGHPASAHIAAGAADVLDKKLLSEMLR